ncbi:MAG: NlpC/P60 family protein [Desulfatirhabdiaceae bacterium]
MPSTFNHSRFLKIPFKDGGRDFFGADCWGIVMLVYREFGIDLPDFKIACGESLKINFAVSEQRLAWCRLTKPSAPCVVVMRMSDRYAQACNHVGVYIGGEKFIHTLKKQGPSLVSVNHPYFEQKIEGFYEFSGN